ncbi:MAG: 3-dehydroquinate synthase [Flavobacteriaceae bacterium]
MSSKKIIREESTIICNDGSWRYFNDQIGKVNPSKIFVLTDTETQKYCLPYFEAQTKILNKEVLTILHGETHKNIATCEKVWEDLSRLGADRKSLLINLGGGVVTDLGGFVACTYQRGISFINIPTSLLAMVDASVGGKNGVDLGNLKNQIGIIKEPEMVLIDTQFLNTLPQEHLRSGMAEMIKHGLIHSEEYLWESFGFSIENAMEAERLIWESIQIKNQIVTEDPFENGLRKTLNYGHTLGHAIESYFLQNPIRKSLLHGEAIAVGMILATYLSSEMLSFPKEKLKRISTQILRLFPKVSFSELEIQEIIKLLIFDKKNTHGIVQFVLLNEIGHPKVNCTVKNDLIMDAFKFYQNSMAE